MKHSKLDEALAILKRHAQAADADRAWPAKSWKALARAGVLAWNISKEDGGFGLDAVSLLDGYDKLASACLTTCFILSQRESAARHLRNMPDVGLRRSLLGPLAK